MDHSTERMMKSSPGAAARAVELVHLARAIDLAFDCAQACTACADACLAEPKVDVLKRCIRLNQDCADVCDAAGRVLSRLGQGGSFAFQAALLQACASACAECGSECEKHAKMHEHCRVCGEACRRCEAACRELKSS
jgi:hypothetical protein